MVQQSATIRRKLLAMILMACTGVLVVSCASFILYELTTFRMTTLRQLSSQGQILAANSTAALAFDNADDAHQTLKALASDPQIVAAALYDDKGRLFAHYPQSMPAERIPASPQADGYRFSENFVVGFQPVQEDSEQRLGTLYLKRGTQDIASRLNLYAGIVAAVAVFSILLALGLTRQLQRKISGPILSLAKVARSVSDHSDYSVRAETLGDGELFTLTESFNQMLTQIEQQNLERTQSEERVREILNASPSAVIVIDRDGLIGEWNAAAESIFGMGSGDALGNPFVSTFVAPAFQNILQLVTDQLFESPAISSKSRSFEMQMIRRDGSGFQGEIAIGSLKLNQSLKICMFVTDVTEKRRAEAISRKNFELEETNRQIMEANRLKSEFLANMSHELRTPLNGIIGFSEFMVEGKPGPLNAKQVEYLGDILSSSRHLLQLINDVLDLAKVEAGRMEFFPETCSIGRLVDEVCSVLRLLAHKKSITVDVHVEEGLDEAALDPSKFKQVLYNLLSNAIKFTDDEGRVEVRASKVGDGRFRVAVKDTGIGIKEEDLGRLFLEFEQLESGASRRYGGTGLGLALSRKIVEMQGGTILAESEVGMGSTFTVVLPLEAKELSNDELSSACG